MLSSINPRTGEVDYRFCEIADVELDSICRQLRDDQPDWAELDVDERYRILLGFADRLKANAEALIAVLIQDAGYHQLAAAQIITPEFFIREAYAAFKQLAESQQPSETGSPGLIGRQQFVPYQLVGNISPWNFPLSLSFIDVWPALIAGCAAIVKPSELTSRWVDVFEPILESVPELHRVLRVVRGGGETGAAIIDRVDMVCFTGSVDTGRKVAAAAGRNFIPASLELGGKDAAIVTRNSDLSRSVNAVLKGAISVTGQSCMAIERVYVDEDVYDEFVRMLIDAANQISINYPDIRGGHLGPFIDQRQAVKVQSHIEDAVANGAEIAIGGHVIDYGGKWMLPTVVTGVDHSMSIMRDETFGPVIPVMKFASVEEAIRLANDSQYGLSAAVFSDCEQEAGRIAEALNVGVVSINDVSLQSATHVLAGESFNFSGLGRSRLGSDGVARFLRAKAIIVNAKDRVSTFAESYYSEKDDERSGEY